MSKEHVYLTHLPVDRLARASGLHAPLIRVLAYTGLRWGEVSGLRVGDVDLGRRRRSVNVNAVLVAGKVVVGTPKTHKRRVGERKSTPTNVRACFCGDDTRHLLGSV